MGERRNNPRLNKERGIKLRQLAVHDESTLVSRNRPLLAIAAAAPRRLAALQLSEIVCAVRQRLLYALQYDLLCLHDVTVALKEQGVCVGDVVPLSVLHAHVGVVLSLVALEEHADLDRRRRRRGGVS